MSDPFLSEIQIFAGTFPPRAWGFCDGQVLSVSQQGALFSLVGTFYGGDGRVSFGLPEMRGRTPIGQGAGPALTPRLIGARGGSELASLNLDEMPSHGHVAAVPASNSPPTADDPVDAYFANPGPIGIFDADHDTSTANLNNGSGIGSSGLGQAHENMQPFLALNYIISLAGLYPPRP